jgi:uncharacterized phage infection (PIP) family protein YhgE
MRRTLGLVFVIFGVVGMVASLLVIPAIWVVRNVADDYVATLASNVSQPLDQASATSAEFRDRLAGVRGALGQVGQQADGAAARGSIEKQAADRLLGVLDQIQPEYVRLREAYTTIRERLIAASQAFEAIKRLLPGLQLPDMPTEQLASIDTQLQMLDASLREIRSDLAGGSLPDNVPGVAALRQVGETIRGVDARLGEVVTTANNIEARIAQIRGQLNQALERLNQIILRVAIGLSVLCIYVAVLHGALFAYGRVLRRRDVEVARAIAPTTAPAVQPDAV